MDIVSDIAVDAPFPSLDENRTQADFIKNEMNFDIDPNDPFTKASLSDHPVNEWMDILGNGQLRKKVIKSGKENSRPNRTDLCVLNFTGTLEDGTVVEKEEDLTIHLGDVDIIQGLDLAIALMDVGEEAIIEVDPRFAYGSFGRSATDSLPEIPSGAKITYNITLKSTELEPNVEEGLSIHKKREIGNKKRERGNWWFKRQDYTLAIQCYRRSLEYLTPANETDLAEEKSENAEQVTDSDLQALLEDSLVVYNNMAAAQMQCEAYEPALNSLENVLRCQPLNVKALFRKGKILHFKQEYAKAVAVLSQALKIDPDNKAIQKELEILKKKSAKDAQHEKNLYRKMLGTKNDKKKEKSTNETKKIAPQVTWSLLGGTIATVVGILIYKFMS